MDHQDFLVTVYNADHEPIGAKPRRDIDKFSDIVDCTQVLVFTPDHQIILGRIPENPKNLEPGKISSTAATIRRENETPVQAAKRALADELGVNGTEPEYIGQEFFTLDNGVRKIISICVAVVPFTNIEINLERTGEMSSVDRAEFESIVNQENTGQVLKLIWQKHQSALAKFLDI